MKRDIRELFKDYDREKNELPYSHRDEFLNKLKKSRKTRTNTFSLRIAVTFLLLVSLGYFTFFTKEKPADEVSVTAKLKEVEKDYLKKIEGEWKRFLLLTDDKKLISRYEKKLSRLDDDYQRLIKIFSKQPNNIAVLEDLITNLKYRLQALKEIQEHIESLNQKNKSYETIIL